MMQKCVALLGRRDEPTDAIAEYCQYLRGALREHDFQMEIVRAAWKEEGWAAAQRELRQQAQGWRGAWVFVQFTALAWSERGFPMRFLEVLRVLREAQARVAVVYHDVEPYSGTNPDFTKHSALQQLENFHGRAGAFVLATVSQISTGMHSSGSQFSQSDFVRAGAESSGARAAHRGSLRDYRWSGG